MKYLNRQPPPEAFRYTPYTLEEINGHLDIYKIWATIIAIKQEAQEAVREAYDRGYHDGVYDRGD